ncbi:hypothetical protein [Peterkaempfera bronchialis]|uniref:Uncharacterized protein n=1 Tax=Peterkaempfera bronchialis TaxID=2126346 RepID=A0A345STX6_9ACTN|nr:hypothetical protein [Peterkaempfera bronchialis]AXI77181.1 hypothetical protein C7M71_006750 [Peterkaempfera bronchialis]
MSPVSLEYVSKPVPELIHEIGTLRRGVFDLLQGRQHPQQTIQLYLAASRLSGLVTRIAPVLPTLRRLAGVPEPP